MVDIRKCDTRNHACGERHARHGGSHEQNHHTSQIHDTSERADDMLDVQRRSSPNVLILTPL